MEIQRELSEIIPHSYDCCPPAARASLEEYQDQLRPDPDKVSERLSKF